jgi:Ca2+-dependent lipid-binding protein
VEEIDFEMHLKTIGILLAIFATAGLAAPGRGEDRTRLRFKVSARGLKDKDTGLGSIDPYIYIYYTENESTSETKLGRSETLRWTRNPDWSKVFDFNFDRNKHQRFHIYVYDHDRFMRDDKAGEVWVTVSDFVDSDQHLQVNLKKGYLILKRA